jgi:hypothetical protein
MYISTYISTTGRGPISTEKFEDFLGRFFAVNLADGREWGIAREG